MITAARLTLALATIPVFALPASGWAEERTGRYTMMPTDGGFVRLDTETGVTSFCKQDNGLWGCEAMPDSQQKLRDDVARLEAENKALKGEMKQMEDALGLSPSGRPGPSGAAPDAGQPMSPDAGPPAPKVQIPTEQDVDRMFDYIEGMVRKFKDRIERMEKDPLPTPAPSPSPTPAPADPTL